MKFLKNDYVCYKYFLHCVYLTVCKQHDALFSNLKNIWLCSGISGSVTSRKVSGKVNMKTFEQNSKNYVGIYVWRCGSSELWCNVNGQEVPAILKQAVKKSFLDWLHLKIKETTILHNIGHHKSSDKVSTSQQTWVLKSTTVRSSNFTCYWKPFVSYLISSFHRTKHITWCTWKTLRISDTYYGFWVVLSCRWGTQWCIWLRHFAMSLNVTD